MEEKKYFVFKKGKGFLFASSNKENIKEFISVVGEEDCIVIFGFVIENL